MGVPAGLFLSTVVFGLVERLDERRAIHGVGLADSVPLSILLVGIGMFIRLKIMESPAFRRLQESGRTESRPLVVAMRDYRRPVLLAMGMRVAENGLFYVYHRLRPELRAGELSIPRSTMLLGRDHRGAGRPDCDPELRRALRSHRPTSGVSPRRGLLAALRVPVLLAAADAVADRGWPRDSARRGVRAQRHVRSAGRLFLRALRRQRALQRRVARAISSHRWRQADSRRSSPRRSWPRTGRRRWRPTWWRSLPSPWSPPGSHRRRIKAPSPTDPHARATSLCRKQWTT